MHCNPSISLLTVCRIYRLSLNSISRRVSTRNLYHNQVLSAYLCNTLSRARYRIFLSFSFITHFAYLELILCIIFTYFSLNFVQRNSSSRAFRYAPFISRTWTILFSRASIIMESITKSVCAVEEAKLFLYFHSLYFLPSAQVLPFIGKFCFYFITNSSLRAFSSVSWLVL